MSEEKKEQLEDNVFDQKLLSKIKQEKISPKPKWHFLLKNYVVWTIGLIALLIGAGAVSVLTYLLSNNDFAIHQEINKSLGEFLLLTLPYFWLIFLGLFVFVIYYNIKHTKHGYRYPIWLILLTSVLASLVLGEILFSFKIGEGIDRVLSRNAPLYEFVINPQLDFWSNPEEGRLIGVPIEFFDDDNFILIDQNKKTWKIISASSTVSKFLEKMPMIQEMMQEENAPLPPIRLLGEQISEQEFLVEKIMPFQPGRAFFDRPGHRPRNMRELRCPEKKNGEPCVLESEGPMRSQPLSNLLNN